MNQMRICKFALWVALAGGWTSAFFTVGAMVGGVQWIAHSGHGRPATLNLLMAALCAVVALQSLRGVKVPSFLPMSVAAGAVLHMLNIVGLFLIGTPLALPFYWLATLLPTNPYVFRASNLSIPVAFVAIWLLPVATCVAAIILRKAEPQKVATEAHCDA